MPKAASCWRFAGPRFWPTWIGLGLLRAVSALPLPFIAFLGSGLGLLVYALHARRRHIVQRNLDRCFPMLGARDRTQLTRAHFRAFGQGLFDVGLAWWASAARLKRLVRFRGREHFDQALHAKKNIILLAPHFIGMEIGGMRLTMEGPMTTMFRRPDNELVCCIMERARKRFHVRLIEHDKPLTALVRQIKSGIPFYYLPDQNASRRKAVFAPFFGIPAATFAVLPRLAQLTESVVIPCGTRQLPFGRGYEVIFQPALDGFPSDNTLADVTRMNAAIESVVREMPEQYLWIHQRFRTRPKGEADFYSRARSR